MSEPTYRAATELYRRGYSVIPIRTDGSKAPAVSGWMQYADTRCDRSELEQWYRGPTPYGIGVVCGPASGNLVVLDCEGRDGVNVIDEVADRLPPEIVALLGKCRIVRTPSGGTHVYLHLTEPTRGGRYARFADGKCKVEVRGYGHQVVAPGSPTACHPTQQRYICTNDGHNPPPIIGPETYARLLLACTRVCERVVDKATPLPPPSGEPCDDRGVRVGDDFNRRGVWSETGLDLAGWTWAGGETPWVRGCLTRPGKAVGVSATIGMVHSQAHGWPLLWLFSTNAMPFEADKGYHKFAVYAILHHDGDYSAAARALADRGYGSPIADSPTLILPTTSAAEAAAIPGRIFKWASELAARIRNDKWLWEGYLSRGGITLLSALWKAGKTTLLQHLIRSFASEGEFLGRTVTAARVLYVTEEHEELWAERRDSIALGDHCGFICRPFSGRTTVAEWRAFLLGVQKAVEDHQFDLVIFDTLSKLWPVTEENDAGQVENALMPLWPITTAGGGTAILLVHHNRKSGGQDFTGARGSGGLPAFCETLIEFGRPPSEGERTTRRVLNARGRYRETPEKWLIDLTPTGYVGLGDPDDPGSRAAVAVIGAADRAWQDAILTALETAGETGLTLQEIREHLRDQEHGVRDAIVATYLEQRFDDGEITRSGTGKGRSAFRYYVHPVAPPVALPSDETPSGAELRNPNPDHNHKIGPESE